MEPRQALVKAVVDDPLFDSDDITISLMMICRTAIKAPTTEAWIRLLIKPSDLLEVCVQGFISITKKEKILLRQSQRNHYHFDLYTKALELELTNEHMAPFSRLLLNQVKLGLVVIFLEPNTRVKHLSLVSGFTTKIFTFG